MNFRKMILMLVGFLSGAQIFAAAGSLRNLSRQKTVTEALESIDIMLNDLHEDSLFRISVQNHVVAHFKAIHVQLKKMVAPLAKGIADPIRARIQVQQIMFDIVLKNKMLHDLINQYRRGNATQAEMQEVWDSLKNDLVTYVPQGFTLGASEEAQWAFALYSEIFMSVSASHDLMVAACADPAPSSESFNARMFKDLLIAFDKKAQAIIAKIENFTRYLSTELRDYNASEVIVHEMHSIHEDIQKLVTYFPHMLKQNEKYLHDTDCAALIGRIYAQIEVCKHNADDATTESLVKMDNYVQRIGYQVLIADIEGKETAVLAEK